MCECVVAGGRRKAAKAEAASGVQEAERSEAAQVERVKRLHEDSN